MAAASRAPGPADARIPCALCGGLIHPIAGRCKHCKGDLSALRAARPAAAAALPPLVAQPAVVARPPSVPPDPYTIAANGHHNGHAGPYHAPISPAQVATAAAAYHQPDLAQPILPPRPTGRMPVAPRATWKSWPVIVIILAVIAIVTAIVLMVWPPGSTAEARPTPAQPVPAPERMDTSPLPPAPPPPRTTPPSPSDPWSNRAPAPPGRQQPPDIDDPDLQDPLANDPFSRRGGSLTASSSLMTAMMTHACDRLSQCGATDAALKSVCDLVTRQAPRSAPPSCPAARRCLAHIDEMDCDASQAQGAAALSRLLLQFTDCTEALSC